MAYEKETKVRDDLWKYAEMVEGNDHKILSECMKDAGYTIENLLSRNEFLSERDERLVRQVNELESKYDEQNAYIKTMQSAIITWFIETYGGSGRE